MDYKEIILDSCVSQQGAIASSDGTIILRELLEHYNTFSIPRPQPTKLRVAEPHAPAIVIINKNSLGSSRELPRTFLNAPWEHIEDQ